MSISSDNKMKAVIVEAPGKVSVMQIPMPKTGDYDCLVKTMVCGFCNGTDLQCITGSLSHGSDAMEYPCVLGHEACGEVVQLGSKVRHIKTGDRFIRPNLPFDPEAGYAITYGNMSEYTVVTDYKAMWEDGLIKSDGAPYMDNCAPVPSDISFEEGAIIVTLCEALSAVTHFGISEGQHTLIYGAGPIGLAALRFLVLMGVHVTVTDGVAERLELAKELGAEHIYNFAAPNGSFSLDDIRYDAVIDAVGSSKIILDGSHKLKSGGKVCSMGVLRPDDSHIDVKKLQNNTALHMHNFQCDRFKFVEPIVEYVREGKLDISKSWSHKLPLEDIEGAMELIKTKKALKVLLEL